MNKLETLAGSLTLRELAAKTGTSVGAIVDFAMDDVTQTKTSTKRSSKNDTVSDIGVVAAIVDTRSPKARQRYDDVVLAELLQTKSWMKAADLRRKVGGTPLQMRSSLNRLVADDKVTYQGKARATTYKAKAR